MIAAVWLAPGRCDTASTVVAPTLTPAHCVASIRLQHAKLLHAVAQDVAGDAQEVSGSNLIVFGELQGFADQAIFDAVIGLTGMGQEELFEPFVEGITWEEPVGRGRLNAPRSANLRR